MRDNNSYLTIGNSNSKLAGQGIATFALPSGFTCPGAMDCQTFVDLLPDGSNKVRDGKHQEHRCYAASMEAAFPSVRASTRRNMEMLKKAKTVEGMAALIELTLAQKKWRNWRKIRVHTHGDFFNENYFMAWMEAARRDPTRFFYAYTKSLPYWVKFMALIPTNFVLTASRGGRFDHLIDEHGLRESVVVYHPDEAKKLRIKIDHDDSLARNPKVKKFGLLIHGTQPAGSKAQAAKKRLEQEGVEFSYGRGAKK